jgi:hypothetical protein
VCGNRQDIQRGIEISQSVVLTSALSGLSFGVANGQIPHETLRESCSRHASSSKVLVLTLHLSSSKFGLDGFGTICDNSATPLSILSQNPAKLNLIDPPEIPCPGIFGAGAEERADVDPANGNGLDDGGLFTASRLCGV